MLKVKGINHIALVCRDMKETVEFYTKVLGMKVEIFGEGRTALCFGQQKINLHQAGNEFEPKANSPTKGSADICFLTETSIEKVSEHLQNCNGCGHGCQCTSSRFFFWLSSFIFGLNQLVGSRQVGWLMLAWL